MGNVPEPPAAPAQTDPPIKRLIVAVHGIGDQYRFSTIQAVARQIAEMANCPTPFPLGGFHPPPGKVRALRFETDDERFSGTGFAEVFWADIHQEAQKTHDTIEESKAWARTMVERMKQLDRGSSAARGFNVTDKDSVNYAKTAAVLGEMIETIKVLDNLCFLAAKAGLFEFSLRDLLDDYLGAVQLVAEFEDYGGQIFGRFSKIMRDMLESHPTIEHIYIVAHSEGTVVTFQGLLAALSEPGGADEPWVKKVAGFMTIGSPIDKHIVLFPKLWQKYNARRTTRIEKVPFIDRVTGKEKVAEKSVEVESPWENEGVKLQQPIVWWNYYDLGDPVGFQLDSAREWMIDHTWTKSAGNTNSLAPDGQPFFQFPPENDIGFSRYFLPGKAHNDYWTDKGVFEHFFGQLIPGTVPEEKRPSRPSTNYGVMLFCSATPYILAYALLLGATYLIYTACMPFIGERYLLHEVASNIVGIASLLAGVTVTSRIPRLTKVGLWYLLPPCAFAAGVAAYLHLVSANVLTILDASFPSWIPGCCGMPVVWVAAFIALSSAALSRWKLTWGMWPLMSLAGIATIAVPLHIVRGKELSVLPLALSTAAFLYLWWLAALLFDLTFVWHRYIRSNQTTDILKHIRRKRRQRMAERATGSSLQSSGPTPSNP